MTPWEEFKQTAVDRPLRLTRRESDWVFAFGEDLSMCVAAMWRIRTPREILVTDYDDGHQFGLPAPVDAEKRANEILERATVLQLENCASTGDVTIRLSKDLTIDVLTNSSGYESWQAYNGNELAAVGRNSG